MKTKAFWIKTSLLSIILIIESYFVTESINTYVESEMFFMPPWRLLLVIAGLLLLVLYTYSLTIGGWDKWEQYVLVPLPISIGIWLNILQKNPGYASLIALMAFLLLIYDTFLANRIKEELIYFKPRLILKFSSKGVIFMYSLLAAGLVFLHSAEKTEMINIGEKLGEITQDQYEKIVQPQINEKAQKILEDELEGKGLPVSPEMFSMLGGISGDSNSLIGGLPTINLDLKDTIEKEFNALMAPYRKFVPSLIALLVFALIRFVGGFSLLIFSNTVGLVFLFFKSIGLLHIKQVQVMKEEISFDSSDVKEPTLERSNPVRTAPVETISPKS